MADHGIKGTKMDGMTTDDKLLGQDDIDALLGEAGIEGNYDTPKPVDTGNRAPLKPPTVRFLKGSDDDAKSMIAILRNKAFLVREDDIKVIWNASGTFPLASGFNLNIQDRDYVSLGVLYNSHLVVKDMGQKN